MLIKILNKARNIIELNPVMQSKLVIKCLLICMICTAVIFSLNSCCTEIYCPGADDLSDIFLVNFSIAETDSVIVVSYQKDSDFEIVIDSFMVPDIDSLNGGRINLFLSPMKISAYNDHKIYFFRTNSKYTITGFKTSQAECNNCSPFFVKDYYKRLDGYEINGKFKSLGYLEIDKLTD